MPLGKQPLQLNADFKYVLEALEKTHRSLFVTGRAGTGKSTLLQLFRKTTNKKVVVVAPTGVAALNVGGQTIHSYFGFPARLLTPRDIVKRKRRRLFQKMEVLVIDEISMVRADLLDAIDIFLRTNRENPMPFGGVQVVFFGDLFQLPPVVASQEEKQLFQTYYSSPYFFSAKVLETEFQMEMVELRQTYRQQELRFVRLLDAVRTNRLDYEDLEDLNTRHIPDFEPDDYYLTLSARNAKVDEINQRELAKLPGYEYLYLAKISGNFQPRLFPTEASLKLKKNAQVMFVKNDPERKFVNGTIGIITELDEEGITVKVEEAGRQRYVEAEPLSWEVLKYKIDEKNTDNIETEVVGTFEQYPLKPAWAITIHKSQGKTFDKAVIDLGKGAFEHGQTYVALSRCRTLDGIVLKQPLRLRDIMVDERIVEFYEQMQ